MSVKKRVAHPTTYPHIVKTEGVCGGQAIIEGTRIAVWHIVGYYYKVGMSVDAWDSSDAEKRRYRRERGRS